MLSQGDEEERGSRALINVGLYAWQTVGSAFVRTWIVVPQAFTQLRIRFAVCRPLLEATVVVSCHASCSPCTETVHVVHGSNITCRKLPGVTLHRCRPKPMFRRLCRKMPLSIPNTIF